MGFVLLVPKKGAGKPRGVDHFAKTNTRSAGKRFHLARRVDNYSLCGWAGGSHYAAIADPLPALGKLPDLNICQTCLYWAGFQADQIGDLNSRDTIKRIFSHGL